MTSRITTARRPRSLAERQLRDAARAVYAEQLGKRKAPAQAWDRATDLVDCDLVSLVVRDEKALGLRKVWE